MSAPALPASQILLDLAAKAKLPAAQNEAIAAFITKAAQAPAAEAMLNMSLVNAEISQRLKELEEEKASRQTKIAADQAEVDKLRMALTDRIFQLGRDHPEAVGEWADAIGREKMAAVMADHTTSLHVIHEMTNLLKQALDKGSSSIPPSGYRSHPTAQGAPDVNQYGSRTHRDQCFASAIQKAKAQRNGSYSG